MDIKYSLMLLLVGLIRGQEYDPKTGEPLKRLYNPETGELIEKKIPLNSAESQFKLNINSNSKSRFVICFS